MVVSRKWFRVVCSPQPQAHSHWSLTKRRGQFSKKRTLKPITEANTPQDRTLSTRAGKKQHQEREEKRETVLYGVYQEKIRGILGKMREKAAEFVHCCNHLILNSEKRGRELWTAHIPVAAWGGLGGDEAEPVVIIMECLVVSPTTTSFLFFFFSSSISTIRKGSLRKSCQKLY